MEEQIKPQNQEDVNPTSQQDYIQEVKDKLGNLSEDETELQDKLPKTNGTGGNNPVSTPSSLIIKEDDYSSKS